MTLFESVPTRHTTYPFLAYYKRPGANRANLAYGTDHR
jgi:hypothetical protein